MIDKIVQNINKPEFDHDYHVAYPSGKILFFDGNFRRVALKGETSPVIEDNESQMIVLDPRAIIRDRTGKVIYSPSMNSQLGETFKKWMIENPWWDKA